MGLNGLFPNVEQNSEEMSAKLLRGLPPDSWPEYILIVIPLRFISCILYTEVLW